MPDFDNLKVVGMAMQIPPSRRTQGDGMEKTDNDDPIEQTIVLHPRELLEPIKINKAGINVNSKVKNFSSAVKLTPKTIDKEKKNILANLKNKEPKFVPYEPYKAAVRPIIPSIQTQLERQAPKKKKFISILKVGDKKKCEIIDSQKEKEADGVNWEAKYRALESEVQTLQQENRELENQLKFQVQVNGELKNLLVAAVGEDLETKVHVLTEDKLHLAQALLKSAESLTTHQEQTEWLAGQCEVWRSKFLSSSVMVEELARWKAALSQKVNEAHDVIKKLIEEKKQIKEFIIKAHKNLCQLKDNFDLHNRKTNLKDCSIIDVSSENLKLTEVLIVELLGSKKKFTHEGSYLHHLRRTAAEESAEHVLTNPTVLELIAEPDEACNAVVGAAVTLSGQLYLQNHPPKIECCRQCSGDIKLI